MEPTLDTSHSPITPFEEAKFGQEPSLVSLMHELTAETKAALSHGAKTAPIVLHNNKNIITFLIY